MTGLAIKLAVKWVTLALALIFGVVLLTLIFSVLGTITCAVLLGVLMGTNRQFRWQAILISLVFPTVVLSLSHVAKALPWQQSVKVSALCFSAFWILYFLTVGLMFLERKDASEGPTPTPNADEDRQAKSGIASVFPVSAPPPREARLEELQGKWLCDIPGADGEAHCKIIEIADDRVTLSLINSHGQVRYMAKGGVCLERLGPFSTLKILGLEVDPRSAVRKPFVAGTTLLYRVAGSTLTVGANFDGAAPGRDPAIETYCRCEAPVDARASNPHG